MTIITYLYIERYLYLYLYISMCVFPEFCHSCNSCLISTCYQLQRNYKILSVLKYVYKSLC